ncbi:MAG TPA: lysozyme inhibitor LprI family protein, partial [Flavitalea sp.]|nr:lysozyme inhibitor LprI family protein [Flavitalea sp.]
PMGYSYSEVDYVMNNLNEKTNFDILCLATRNFANGYRAAMNCTQREALIVQLFHTLQISKASTEQLIKYISSLPENRDTTKDDDREGEKSDKVPAVVLCNEELDSLEKKHSVIYKKLYASLNPQEQSVLKISQQQWIKNREKKCYLTQQEYAGGSMAGLAHCQCTIEEVQKRIEVLSKNNMSIISN